jgi:catechol 2,3-dioxygenase-like lactoylglutathione lyase family enzyme
MNLNQITVLSQDVSRSVEFYKSLGLHLIVDALPRYARFECPNGESTFSIHFNEEVKISGAGVHIYFEVHNLDARVDQLRTAGIQFDLLPKDQPWLWREAHLKDPDGHQIILFSAGENRKNPPWRIA